jgi:hypothetical protein
MADDELTSGTRSCSTRVFAVAASSAAPGLCEMRKLRKYVGETLRISRSDSVPVALVALKVIVAYLFHRLHIGLFSMYGLATKPVRSYREYMTMSELESLQRRANPSREGRNIADSKLAFYRWCIAHGLPTPRVFGYAAREKAEHCPDVPFIGSDDRFFELLDTAGTDTFLLKREYGSHGHGLIRFRYSGGHLRDDNGDAIDTARLLSWIRQQDTRYLLQAAERPHPELYPIMPGPSLGTVRMVTFMSGERPTLWIACMRMPLGANVADNFDRGQAGNLLASVDVQSGRIRRCLVPSTMAPTSLTRCNTHPETGAEIAGFTFPHWDSVTRLVTQAASRLNSMYTVGWDAALTDNGPSLVEVNWRYDIEFMQILEDRGLRTDIEQNFAPALASN